MASSAASPVPTPEPVQLASASLSVNVTSSLVLILRHATAPGVGDPTQFKLHDCATQRNLNPIGQEQSRRIAQSLIDLGVIVKQIWSSQWCRALETAQIISSTLPSVDVTGLALLNSTFRDRNQAQSQTEALRQFIKALDPSAGPYLMISHQVNITDLAGIYPPSGHGVWLRLTGDPASPWQTYPADTDNLTLPALEKKQP
jgi:phosphohistidine phosphatase SixA